MIAAVSTPEQKEHYSALIAGMPYFQAVMGTYLTLWADNPGAPLKMYLAGEAALSMWGNKAVMCGMPDDWEELTFFLRFAGIENLLCDTTPPKPWQPDTQLYRFVLGAGQQLPLAEQPDGFVRNESPSILAVSRLLFGDRESHREYFYTVACTAVNHGLGCCRTLEREGKIISTVGCYERANGEAYMSTGETVPELRGQGLGGWLIVSLANELAGQGWNVSLLCVQERCHFYRRLGFAEDGQIISYRLEKQE